MESKKIINIFKGRKGESIRTFKKSAVVIPLIQKEEGLHVLFEVRALNLKSQPGDVCLPGGKVEQGEMYSDAAAREFKEELGLSDEDFEIVGEMDYFVSPYGSIIYPYVAEVRKLPENYNTREVDHVFSVPLDFFLNSEPLCHPMKVGPQVDDNFPFKLIRGGREYKFTDTLLNQYFYNYNSYVIWGVTALIIKRFSDIIKSSTDAEI